MPLLPDRAELEDYLKRLWPLFRSITGEGQRQTHAILGELMPLNHLDFSSGTKIFDWQVPQEWRFNQAYITDPNGHRILDAKNNNLHLVNYSRPFSGKLTLEELQKHLHSLPSRPKAIPYVTNYYSNYWGFCLSEEFRNKLADGVYEVVVDTELFDGIMRVSDAVLPGKTKTEILFSSYTCHPSMANNELSGPLVLSFLYRALAALPERNLTYRFVLGPENIGSIAYLSRHGNYMKKSLAAGYVLSNIGDTNSFTLKKAQIDNSLAERAAERTFIDGKYDYRLIEFDPRGADERNYCSPGFNLPVCLLMRSYFDESEVYHTSDDNLQFINAYSIIVAIELCFNICQTLEKNKIWKSTTPFGEPFFSRHNLAPTISTPTSTANQQLLARRWIMNQATGENDLLSISTRSNLPLALLENEVIKLENAGLLKEIIRNGR